MNIHIQPAENVAADGDKASAQRAITIVLGMHRSGTSALTKALETLGINLGDNLMPAIEDNNDKGFWEDLDIARFNDQLLIDLKSRWHSLGRLEPETLQGPPLFEARREARQLLEDKMEGRPRFGFKDPRTSILLPFWLCVLDDMNLASSFAVAVRNPMESALSLRRRDGLALIHGLLGWTKHMSACAEALEGRRCLFVSYDDLLDTPYAQIERLAALMRVAPPAEDSDAVAAYAEEFLDSSLHRQRVSDLELRRSAAAPEVVADLYEAARALCRADVFDAMPALEGPWQEASRYLSTNNPVLSFIDTLSGELSEAKRASKEAAAAARAAQAEQERLAPFEQNLADARRELEAARAENEQTKSHAHTLSDWAQRRLVDPTALLPRPGADNVLSCVDAAIEPLAQALDDARFEAAHATERLERTQAQLEAAQAALEEQAARAERAERELAKTAGALEGKTQEAQKKTAAIADLEAAVARSERAAQDLKARAERTEEDLAKTAGALKRKNEEARKKSALIVGLEAAAARAAAAEDRRKAELADVVAAAEAARTDARLAKRALLETRASLVWRACAPLRRMAQLIRR